MIAYQRPVGDNILSLLSEMYPCGESSRFVPAATAILEVP